MTYTHKLPPEPKCANYINSDVRLARLVGEEAGSDVVSIVASWHDEYADLEIRSDSIPDEPIPERTLTRQGQSADTHKEPSRSGETRGLEPTGKPGVRCRNVVILLVLVYDNRR